MNAHGAAIPVTDVLVAATGVVALYYAWRGIGHLPILARLMTGLALAVTVLGSFGFVLLTFGAGGHAFVREPRMPWNRPAVASSPSPPPAKMPEKPSAAVSGSPQDMAAAGERPSSDTGSSRTSTRDS